MYACINFKEIVRRKRRNIDHTACTFHEFTLVMTTSTGSRVSFLGVEGLTQTTTIEAVVVDVDVVNRDDVPFFTLTFIKKIRPDLKLSVFVTIWKSYAFFCVKTSYSSLELSLNFSKFVTFYLVIFHSLFLRSFSTFLIEFLSFSRVC